MSQHDARIATKRRSSRLHDIDGDVEELTIAVATARDPHERAELQQRVVLLALPLADAIARRYARRGIETDDLIQVGRTALVMAVHRYRPGTGAGFSAFASPTISGEIKRWFRDHGWSARPSRRIQELRSLVVRGEEQLRHALARDPRDDELAAALGVTTRDVAEARLCTTGYHAASLDVVTPSGAGLLDQVLVQQCLAESLDLRAALGWAVARLSERQRLILRLRFVEELTQEQIGGHIGVSQMQVSRLLRAALDQLRGDLDIELDTPRRAA